MLLLFAENTLLLTVLTVSLFLCALPYGSFFLYASFVMAVPTALAWLGYLLYAPLPTPIARATGRRR